MSLLERVGIVVLFSLIAIGILLSSGCAAFPGKPPTTGADVGLLQPCAQPPGSAETNWAIAAWLLDTKQALRACNQQITTFKESANGRP